MAIAKQTIGTTPTTIYTSVGDNVVSTLYLRNDTAGALVVQVYVVPSGSVADSTTLIHKDLSIAATTTYKLDTEKLILSTGDTIQATTTVGTSIYALLSYYGS